MECRKNIKKRKSIRLKHFNYSNAGAYFVTICAEDMVCLFGEVLGGEIVHKEFGHIVINAWAEAIRQRPDFSIDEFVLMPNHFHAIVWIKEKPVGVDLCVNPREAQGQRLGQTRRSAPTNTPLFEIVQRFKTYTTTQYIQNVKTKNYPRFNKRLWQRNYYERVIRNDDELNNTRQYILDNPKNWGNDQYNSNP